MTLNRDLTTHKLERKEPLLPNVYFFFFFWAGFQIFISLNDIQKFIQQNNFIGADSRCCIIQLTLADICTIWTNMCFVKGKLSTPSSFWSAATISYFAQLKSIKFWEIQSTRNYWLLTSCAKSRHFFAKWWVSKISCQFNGYWSEHNIKYSDNSSLNSVPWCKPSWQMITSKLFLAANSMQPIQNQKFMGFKLTCPKN